MLEQLQQLGLSKKEAQVYLALLKLGQTSAGEIIKSTHYHREIIYTSLHRLIEKDLANFVIRKKIRYFQAASPEKILILAQENYQTAKNLLPELLKLHEKSIHRQFVQIYEGFEGLKKVREFMLQVLKPGESIRILGASGVYFKVMGKYSDVWQKKRAKKRIWYLVQLYQTIAAETKEKFKNYEYLKIKVLPQNYEMPSSTAIFADYVVIQIWGEEPVMILIENKKVAQSYKDTFDLLWKLGK